MKYEYLYWNCEKLLEAYKTKQLSPVEVVRATLKNAKKYLEIFKNHKYIFNLGHGVMPETKPDNVKILVDYVKDFR